METLFRFVLARPPVTQNEQSPSIELSQASQMQAEMGQAQQNANPRNAMKDAARKFIASPGFIDDPRKLGIRDKLSKLSTELDNMVPNKNVSHAAIVKAIEDSFGDKLAKIVKDKTLDTSLAQLRDSILAIKQLPEVHNKPLEGLTNQLRDLEVILKVAADGSFPGTGAALHRFRRRSLQLPSGTDLISSLNTLERQKELERKRREEEEKKRKKAEEQLDLYKRLKAAVKELINLDKGNFRTTPQKPNAGFMVPAANRPVQMMIQEMNQRQQMSQLNLLHNQSLLGKMDLGDKSGGQPMMAQAQNPMVAQPLPSKEDLLQSGTPAFNPVNPADLGFRLNDQVHKVISQNTREILDLYNLDLTGRSLDEIIDLLSREIRELEQALDGLLGRPVKHTFKRMGNKMLMIKSPMPSYWNSIVIGNIFTSVVPELWSDSVPKTFGSVAPAGIADLLVVKQQLVRYEGTEVAHIENVLKGEMKEREHKRRRETEELIFRESEITTSEERELESTTRFEMSQEASEVIQEDVSLTAGLNVSGKYGPVVEFSASAEGSFSRSKEESTKSASRFSQDVTERSANRVTKRVLERSSLRVTNEVVEKTGHSLDNTGGAGHISGVYQWVNKVYQAQMYNYGIRTMYDFMVPEPAAFLIEAMQNSHANAIEIEKPVAFDLFPDQMNESNYHTWVKEYGATDVQPPPEIYITKSLDFNKGGGDKKTDYTHSGQIQIDDGYRAIFGTVVIMNNIWEDSWVVDVGLGQRVNRFSGGDWAWSTNLDNERDSLPFALSTKWVPEIAVGVEVKCQRTDRAMMKWRLETHAKLTNAYNARMAEYEEKLTAIEMQAGVAIEGKNPALNLELMKDELKKNCISILTEQHFDLFSAISNGSNGLPQIDVNENKAEGPYVRFFEQAFEWEHMTWVTYPYFWGRKNQWDERIAYEDTDPLFNQFLKAGYCRVALPVREGFDGAIDHFMTYGEIWNGGPLPSISSPLYLPIADEIAERLDRPGEEFPEGDPWLVRIPTSLIQLRADDKLPKWKQDDDGEWIEDNA